MVPKGSLQCHKILLLFPVLSWMDPLHTLLPYVPKIHSNIIIPSVFRWPF
jgi:hypothetical protein